MEIVPPRAVSGPDESAAVAMLDTVDAVVDLVFGPCLRVALRSSPMLLVRPLR